MSNSDRETSYKIKFRTPDSTDTYHIIVVLDPEDAIAEQNENNNASIYKFKVNIHSENSYPEPAPTSPAPLPPPSDAGLIQCYPLKYILEVININ